ncbi:hypothetical protein A3752_00550 [Oleiphilus sp. HI0081]|nr:hypothetical protein A3732_01425 [Oleiphilus sp. HI0050]KZY49769.1 hypothetical protein A3732_22440 [Oleiphilus sp. HI0050]KZZ24112.1 hypothetical protein A3752_00550 [Oleiphilus sp. HI0081]KZZ75876.1 hypothetical protein A3766_15630 [Oleiphilus sp. HI0132]
MNRISEDSMSNKEVNAEVSPQAASIQETDVIEYLKTHPEFFVQHDYLLNELKIPHASGAAISLGERQVQVFREHRDELKNKLNELISIAHENDAHFEKTKRLLLNLLEVKSLDEIEMVVNEAFKNDANIDFSSILLFGKPSDYPVSEVKVISIDEARGQLGGILDHTRAVCGQFRDEERACLFPNPEEVGSAAVIPLRNGELLGLFCLGSRDAKHFDSSMGSLFLSYISDFISRILPNLLLAAKRQQVEDSVPSLLE